MTKMIEMTVTCAWALHLWKVDIFYSSIKVKGPVSNLTYPKLEKVVRAYIISLEKLRENLSQGKGEEIGPRVSYRLYEACAQANGLQVVQLEWIEGGLKKTQALAIREFS